MAGKKKVEKETASWVGGIEKHSRQIWLAGLGAYAKAGTDGSKAFETLVKEGEKAERQARGDAARLAEAAKVTPGAKPDAGKPKAKPVGKPVGKWGELEDAFDTRLDTAISRLNVPSRDEVAALNTKVDVLMRELERLTGASVPQAPAEPALKPASAKPAAAKAGAARPAVAKPVEKTLAEKKPRVRKPAVKVEDTTLDSAAP